MRWAGKAAAFLLQLSAFGKYLDSAMNLFTILA